jgi:acyl-CoA synthetase (AMP-forming)/AMP-acid ligase II
VSTIHDAAVVMEPWRDTAIRCYADRPRTILDALDDSVRDWGHVDGLHTDEGILTNREFAELVAGAADRLSAAGVGPGDRVATCLRNSLESTIAFFACARIGAVLVCLNTRLKPPQWAYQLGHSRPRLVLSHPEWLVGVKQAVGDAGLDEFEDVVHEVAAGPGPGGALLPEARPWEHQPGAVDEDATFAVLYTSGTTGRPKGVQMTHRAVVHAALTYVRELGLVAGDRSLVVLPMFYISGIVDHIIPHLLTGGTSVMVDGFHAGRVAARLAAEEATYFMGVPAMLGLLLREDESLFGQAALPQLRIAAYGGAPFPSAWVDGLRARMPQMRLFELYGLTETHSPATILRDHEFWRRPGSVGRAIPCIDLKVVDEAGADLPPGAVGELLLKGANLTTGYFHDEEATAAAFDADGWFRTGDLARVDGEGYVYLLDRKKDMIQRGGFKVYGVELEYLLAQHPDVVEAAVVGVPATMAGEDVVAFVVLRPGAEVRPPEIRRWIGARAADYQVPRHVRVVEALPRNPTGKVDKLALRAAETAGG